MPTQTFDSPPPPDDPEILSARGQELLKARRFQEAISVLQEVLRLDPHNTKADELIETAERSMCQELYRTTTPADKTPYFIVPDHILTRFSLSHQESFVASRINGTCDVKSIVMLSPLRELEILQILDKFCKLELIDLK